MSWRPQLGQRPPDRQRRQGRHNDAQIVVETDDAAGHKRGDRAREIRADACSERIKFCDETDRERNTCQREQHSGKDGSELGPGPK